MILSSINISNFRNIANVNLDFDQRCNLLYGKNGSGKTSILETIYCLALGRSFRSHILHRIIRYGSDSLSIFGKIRQNDNYISVGVERSIIKGKQIKVAGEDVNSNIEITKLLPLQILNNDSHRLLDGGSKIRRQFIDWGLFHVKHNFIHLWRKVERTVEQRNAAVRSNSKNSCIKTWNKELSQIGLELHNKRQEYITKLIPIINKISQKLLPDFHITITYFAGWDINIDLSISLEENLKNDLHYGYTTSGPHKADLQLMINQIPIKDALSRGQQKTFLYAMQIAQGILLNQLTDKKCIYLVDDFSAELDPQKQNSLTDILLDLESQIFVTGLTHDELKYFLTRNSAKLFHVEHGDITIF